MLSLSSRTLLIAFAVLVLHGSSCVAFSSSHLHPARPLNRIRKKDNEPVINYFHFHQGRASTPRKTHTSLQLGSADVIANGLGYLVGAGSLALYTPIAIRLVRQQSADGLVPSTWWLKLASYTTSDIYFVRQQYPVSTYVETLVITIEAAIILGLVTYYQSQSQSDKSQQEESQPNHKNSFLSNAGLYVALTTWGLTMAPTSVITLGQATSALLNTGALLPQFALNAQTKSSGDYSPVTAGLACTGCLIRLFTTIQLAESDPILLGTFGVAFLLNGALLAQILWYGVTAEQKTISSLLLSDFVVGSRRRTGRTEKDYRSTNANPIMNVLEKEKEQEDTLTAEKEGELMESSR